MARQGDDEVLPPENTQTTRGRTCRSRGYPLLARGDIEHMIYGRLLPHAGPTKAGVSEVIHPRPAAPGRSSVKRSQSIFRSETRPPHQGARQRSTVTESDCHKDQCWSCSVLFSVGQWASVGLRTARDCVFPRERFCLVARVQHRTALNAGGCQRVPADRAGRNGKQREARWTTFVHETR